MMGLQRGFTQNPLFSVSIHSVGNRGTMKSKKQRKITPPKRYFESAHEKWYREWKEQRNADLEPLMNAIFDKDVQKVKYHFSENLLKRLQSSIDRGARKGGKYIQDQVFGNQ